LDEKESIGTQVENCGLLPETGRPLAFPLDKSKKWSDRGGSTAHRNQRTFGKENPEKPECRIKDRNKVLHPTENRAAVFGG
jgi:hypothetical protein